MSTTSAAHTHRGASSRRDEGLVVWAVIIALLVLGVAIAVANSVYTTSARSTASTNQIAITHRTDAAVADAVARLSSGASVPATRADSTPSCQIISGRSVCYQYWALPVPGNAVDPVRYSLITNTWIDLERNGSRPVDDKGVRAVLVPLEAITYQTTAGLEPVSVNGQIQYTPSPAGLFTNAIHGFANVTLNGPDVSVESYNSSTGANGTKHGTVSSGAFVSYGRANQADTTLLYGYTGPGTVTTTRCTGEACAESDVLAMTQSYAAPSEAAVDWIRKSDQCTATVNGDWVASQNGGRLPGGTTCVKGSLIIDAPTVLTTAQTSLYVHGNVEVSASLNAPATGRVATPGRLAIYSAGQAVSFRATQSENPGTGVAAMLWAPRAVCSTDPAANKDPNSYAGQITYFGSLACNTVSLGGSWRHLIDDAQTVTFRDPAPGASKAWTVGNPQVIDTSGQWDIPVGWQESICVLPSPVNPASYWKLAEPSGLLAADSAGSNDLGWASSTSGRGEGLCGRGASLTPAGQATGGAAIASATEGVSLEWWGNAVVGKPVQAGGVTITVDSTRHVSVTAGGTTKKFPFTVQNAARWHLYTVTVANDGQATLYADGVAKEKVTVGSPTAGGPTKVAAGSSGVVNDAVVYRRTLSETEISDRWSTWNLNVVFSTSDAGTAFTAPSGVRDDGSTRTNLKLAWDAATGTLPTGESTYAIQRSATATGTFTTIGSVPIETTSFSLANPDLGSFFYRVCTLYNGDTRCSTPAVNVVTLPVPAVPGPITSAVTATSVTFSWPEVQWVDYYEVQYLKDTDTAWWGSGGAAGAVYKMTSATASPSFADGRLWKIRVRAVNDAGTSAWSAAASRQIAPDSPDVTVSAITSTTARFSWTTPNGTARFESQYTTGSGWSAIVNHALASPAITHGPTTQGTKIQVRVRSVAADGTTGPWSTTAVAQLTVGGPGLNGWQTSTNFPTINARIINATCPAGTAIQAQYRDQLPQWGASWNGWTGWLEDAVGQSQGATPWSYSTIGDYVNGVNVQMNVRCINKTTGQASGVSGPHQINGLYHPVPAPWGLHAGAGGPYGYRTAGWGATCPAGTTPFFDWWATGNINAGQQGVTHTSWAHTAKAWGTGQVSISAWCNAGGRTGPRAAAAGNFG